MSNQKNSILAQAFDLLRKKYVDLDANTIAFLTEQGKRLINEFHSMGTNVTVNIIAAKLDAIIRSTREQTSNRLSRSSTGEKLPSRSISRSNSDSELVYSLNYPKSQKIRVNVIRDDVNSPLPHRSTHSKVKSHHKTHSNRKNSTKNELIGSKTIEDLLKIANENVSSTPTKFERVIIIDRPKTKSNRRGEKRPTSTYEIRSGLAPTASKVNINYQSLATPSTTVTPPNYYSSQPMVYNDTQWFMMNPYSSNTAVPSTNFYQPFVYYSY